MTASTTFAARSATPRARRAGLVATLGLLACIALPEAAVAQSVSVSAQRLHAPRAVVSGPVIQVGGGYRGGRGHGHGYRYHGHGLGWGGLALGLGIGALVFSRPWEPVVVEPRPTYIYNEPPQTAPQPVPPAPARYRAAPPEPVIYPSQGQTPEQTEADRQACNRWATTQPSAMADASVFHRATLACLEGRGYTVR